IVKTLEKIGVETVFGGSGQSDSDILLALDESKKIDTVIIRHEQAASFMACGYSMFSDKLGVCFSTAGPGAFNLFSGLAVAYSDSLPVLSITPYTAKEYRGKGDLGETTGLNRTPDSQKMFAATTKKSFMIGQPEETCDVLEEAINLAFEGRPGPVNLHIDYEMMNQEVPNYREIYLNIKPVSAEEKEIAEFAAALAKDIKADKKIAAILGYGCVRSHAEDELLKLFEDYQIPFMTTMDAKGILSEAHPLSLGTTGVSGDKGAKKFFKEADTIIAIGNSFAKWSVWKSRADLFDDKTLMQINIDPQDIGKVYQPDFALLSDAKLAVKAVRKELADQVKVQNKLELKKDKFYDENIKYEGELIHPGKLSQEISKLLPKDSIILGDAGAHMMWLHAYLNLDENQIYQNPGTFGPMAANVNASMGIKAANPERPVIACCGDGDYQMAGFELMTAVENKIPVIWVIFNNGEFNIIKMFQLRTRDKEVFNHFMNPDYKSYAEVCGAKGYTVENLAEFAPAFKDALASGGPALIDVKVDPDVYPPFEPYHEKGEKE
ncbi:MAG: thiamine pyrophosphate-binding protein, partial [Bacillota bacterium]